jgi:hypothetical protein
MERAYHIGEEEVFGAVAKLQRLRSALTAELEKNNI